MVIRHKNLKTALQSPPPLSINYNLKSINFTSMNSEIVSSRYTIEDIDRDLEYIYGCYLDLVP